MSLLFRRDKSDRQSLAISTTSGTTNTMDVIFRIMRNVKIDYQTNIININTTGNHVCRYQDINVPILELLHHLLTLCLLEIRVHRGDIKFLFHQG